MKISRTLLFIAPSKSGEAPERRHGFAHLWEKKKKKGKENPSPVVVSEHAFQETPPPRKSTRRARIVSRLFPRLRNPSRKWACERIIAPVRHLSPASIHRSKSAMTKTPRKKKGRKMREKMREPPPPRRNTMRLKSLLLNPEISAVERGGIWGLSPLSSLSPRWNYWSGGVQEKHREGGDQTPAAL